MQVKIWGCRGSIPTPGNSTIKYGGNTTCVTITPSEDEFNPIIIDAGTGIRLLGNFLEQAKRPLELNILFTHSHWDHIQGFPFFKPANNGKNRITLHGCPASGKSLKESILTQMDARNFPISYTDLKGKIEFEEICSDFTLLGSEIQIIKLNHPGGGSGFKFTKDGKQVAFITDHELSPNPYIGSSYGETFEFCKGVDLLIHDAQYLEKEYLTYKGWGHSSIENVFEMAAKAEVERLVITHHDPNRTDDDLDRITEIMNHEIEQRGIYMTFIPAQEGMVIEV